MKAASSFALITGLLLLSSAPAPAGQIAIVNIRLSPDEPVNGMQEVAITNETGSRNGCNSTYPLCDELAITNWTFEVGYRDARNPSPADDPFLFTRQWSSSADDLLPASPLKFDFDLCGNDKIRGCTDPTTTLEYMYFSGTLAPAHSQLFDPQGPMGLPGPGEFVFLNSAFTASLRPSTSFPASGFESQDGYTSELPEPATLTLALSTLLLCPVTAAVRRRETSQRVQSDPPAGSF